MSICSTAHFFCFVFWPDMWLFLSKGVRLSGTDEYMPWHLAIIQLFIGDLSYLHGIGLNLEASGRPLSHTCAPTASPEAKSQREWATDIVFRSTEPDRKGVLMRSLWTEMSSGEPPF